MKLGVGGNRAEVETDQKAHLTSLQSGESVRGRFHGQPVLVGVHDANFEATRAMFEPRRKALAAEKTGLEAVKPALSIYQKYLGKCQECDRRGKDAPASLLQQREELAKQAFEQICKSNPKYGNLWRERGEIPNEQSIREAAEAHSNTIVDQLRRRIGRDALPPNAKPDEVLRAIDELVKRNDNEYALSYSHQEEMAAMMDGNHGFEHRSEDREAQILIQQEGMTMGFAAGRSAFRELRDDRRRMEAKGKVVQYNRAATIAEDGMKKLAGDMSEKIDKFLASAESSALNPSGVEALSRMKMALQAGEIEVAEDATGARRLVFGRSLSGEGLGEGAPLFDLGSVVRSVGGLTDPRGNGSRSLDALGIVLSEKAEEIAEKDGERLKHLGKASAFHALASGNAPLHGRLSGAIKEKGLLAGTAIGLGKIAWDIKESVRHNVRAAWGSAGGAKARMVFVAGGRISAAGFVGAKNLGKVLFETAMSGANAMNQQDLTGATQIFTGMGKATAETTRHVVERRKHVAEAKGRIREMFQKAARESTHRKQAAKEAVARAEDHARESTEAAYRYIDGVYRLFSVAQEFAGAKTGPEEDVVEQKYRATLVQVNQSFKILEQQYAPMAKMLGFGGQGLHYDRVKMLAEEIRDNGREAMHDYMENALRASHAANPESAGNHGDYANVIDLGRISYVASEGAVDADGEFRHRSAENGEPLGKKGFSTRAAVMVNNGKMEVVAVAPVDPVMTRENPDAWRDTENAVGEKLASISPAALLRIQEALVEGRGRLEEGTFGGLLRDKSARMDDERARLIEAARSSLLEHGKRRVVCTAAEREYMEMEHAALKSWRDREPFPEKTFSPERLTRFRDELARRANDGDQDAENCMNSLGGIDPASALHRVTGVDETRLRARLDRLSGDLQAQRVVDSETASDEVKRNAIVFEEALQHLEILAPRLRIDSSESGGVFTQNQFDAMVQVAKLDMDLAGAYGQEGGGLGALSLANPRHAIRVEQINDTLAGKGVDERGKQRVADENTHYSDAVDAANKLGLTTVDGAAYSLFIDEYERRAMGVKSGFRARPSREMDSSVRDFMGSFEAGKDNRTIYGIANMVNLAMVQAYARQGAERIDIGKDFRGVDLEGV